METLSKDILDIQTSYETEKKDKEIVNLNIQNKLKDEKTEQQRLVGVIIISSILLIGVLMFYFWRKRKNYLFQQKISVVKQEALNAQMSDHFVSNTMNSINHFIQQNEREKASEYLLMFSRLVRKVMENSFQKQISLQNDLSVLKDFVRLERLRFSNQNLHLNISIGDEIDLEETMIPPTVLQTIVENSIKHGFKKANGGKINISIHENLGKLVCVVEDNGIGRAASMFAQAREENQTQSYGSGLAKRLATIFGGSYTIEDLFNQDDSPAGTRTMLEFPLMKY